VSIPADERFDKVANREYTDVHRLDERLRFPNEASRVNARKLIIRGSSETSMRAIASSTSPEASAPTRRSWPASGPSPSSASTSARA
jgi:hypothetical protein